MTLTPADVASLFAVFLFWLLTAYLLSHAAARRRAGNWLLALFLVSKSLCFLNGLLLRLASQLAPAWPHAYYWGFSFELLLGPSLYLYTRSVVRGGLTLRPRALVHLVPFVAHLAFMTVRFHRLDGAGKTRLLLAGPLFVGWEQQAVDTLIFVQVLGYLIASIGLFLEYRRAVRETYSSLAGRRLAWLGSLLFYFLGIWVLGYLSVTWQNVVSPGGPSIPGYVFDLMLLSFATMIVFFGLRQPDLFADAAPEERKAVRPRLAPDDAERLLARLRDAMRRDRPYLDPDVTLGDLARSSGVPGRDLSYLLGEVLETCFYDYVNAHRVEAARRLLEDDPAATVADVLQRAGFNSKSVFNAAFKKATGLTPTAYRQARRSPRSPSPASVRHEQTGQDALTTGSPASSRTTLEA